MRKFNLILIVLAALIASYLLISLFLFFSQTVLVFFPTSNIIMTPSEMDLVYEDVWLEVINRKGKKETIHGWWLPNFNGNKKALLYLHGNGENISSNLNRAKFYQQQGFSVFLIDYRGYGKSQGEFPNENRVYEDAQLAYDYLVQKKNFKPESIVVFGHSLGGAIALNLAINQPNIHALIVESTFTSIQDVAEETTIYRLFPLDLILTQKFDSINKINRLKVPVLMIHGTEDETIPVSMSKTLFDKVKVPKKILIIEGANHNNVQEFNEIEYQKGVESFLQFVKNLS